MKTMNKWAQYIIVFAITAIAVTLYLFCYKIDIRQPISIDMDKAIDNFIKIAMIDENSVQTKVSVCEYNIQNLMMFVLTKVCKNVWAGINVFYILTFFMISWSMYCLLIKMEVPEVVSIGLSVLTAFVPFHIDRGEGQMMTSNFFLVPLFLAMFYDIFYCRKTDMCKKGYIILVCTAPFVDIRISIMTCILFGVLLVQCHDMEVTKRSAYYLVLLIAFSTIAANISTVLKTADLEAAKGEGMRILDMIEPIRYHILGRLSDIRLEYDIAFSASGESGLNSLGGLFTIGLFCLMFSLLFEWKHDRRIAWMGMISFFVILIANISGIGLIFEYFGIHVTYWNRMAVFIIVCSAAAVGIILGNIVGKVEGKLGRKALKAEYPVMAFIYILGFFELILRQNM